jgi:tRNA (cytidine/uridine-2'-O-)-methyltransferase
MAVSLHVALVAPEIHWNTGNAGRSCLAAGAQLHLIRPLGFSLADRRVRRAGLDYWPRVAPVVWDEWNQFEAQLPELGSPFFFSADAERSYWEVDFPERCVLIFGSEARGLPAALRQKSHPSQLRLPIADPELRSLNLSTSIGIALYEVLRQRREREAERQSES